MVRVKVRNSCGGEMWEVAICEGRKIYLHSNWYMSKAYAIKKAELISKRLGIKYDRKIVKLHGC